MLTIKGILYYGDDFGIKPVRELSHPEVLTDLKFLLYIAIRSSPLSMTILQGVGSL
jgi:hypothetical protein